jgi:hypothetical protein
MKVQMCGDEPLDIDWLLEDRLAFTQIHTLQGHMKIGKGGRQGPAREATPS